MTSTDRTRGSRRHALRRLLVLAASVGLALAGSGGCGSRNPPPAMPNKLPPGPGQKRQ